MLTVISQSCESNSMVSSLRGDFNLERRRSAAASLTLPIHRRSKSNCEAAINNQRVTCDVSALITT